MANTDIFKAFAATFAPELSGSKRWQAMLRIAMELCILQRPVEIVETGCIRDATSWLGDGQSTVLFAWLVARLGGTASAVDLDPGACRVARRECPNTIVENDDSLRYLMRARLHAVDLLWLDSMDYAPPYPLSELHHAGELAIAYPRLKSGCLIAIDDCHTEDQGKQTFVRAFFERMQIAPIHASYVTIWRKP